MSLEPVGKVFDGLIAALGFTVCIISLFDGNSILATWAGFAASGHIRLALR